MRIRFQADADFNHIIVAGLVRRLPELEFSTAHQAGLAGLQDPAVLAIAAREGRILVTHDSHTMPRHFGEFITRSASPGLVVVPQGLSVARAVEDLAVIWSASQAEEWTNRIAYLPL